MTHHPIDRCYECEAKARLKKIRRSIVHDGRAIEVIEHLSPRVKTVRVLTKPDVITMLDAHNGGKLKQAYDRMNQRAFDDMMRERGNGKPTGN